jgi:hypothetical protein
MKKAFISLSFTMIALILFTLSPIKNVNANSAQTHWDGVTATGAMITDEDCPIIVQNENLTFNINKFPQTNYISEEAARAYNDSVTAEYTFYNPADYTVNATLAFPFGIFPYYGYYHTPENSYERIEEDFSVTVNDESVEIVKYAFLNNIPLHIMRWDKEGNAMTGFATVTEFSDDNPHDDVASVTISLQGKGAPEFKTGVADPRLGA